MYICIVAVFCCVFWCLWCCPLVVNYVCMFTPIEKYSRRLSSTRILNQFQQFVISFIYPKAQNLPSTTPPGWRCLNRTSRLLSVARMHRIITPSSTTASNIQCENIWICVWKASIEDFNRSVVEYSYIWHFSVFVWDIKTLGQALYVYFNVLFRVATNTQYSQSALYT